MVWSVCIFAHNEERLLHRCLAALEGAAAGGDYVVHVMENGSTDETASVAKAFAAVDPRIHVHELELGDKSNAWNEYVHRVSQKADMHVFIDGDVQPSKGAFKSLAHAFEGSPEALAAAALPASGRNRRAWASRLFQKRYLSGNLYAFSNEAWSVFRERDLRLPTGAVGEDGLISYLMLTDLKGGRDDNHKDRIAIAAGATFEFDSLSIRPHDIAIYHGRLRRYSKRFFQNEVLYDLLKRKGVSALPENINEIYTTERLARYRPRLHPQFFMVDRETLRRLRGVAEQRAA